MSQQLSGKVQYLRGLADGLHMDSGTKEGKLLLAVIDTLEEFAKEIARIDEQVTEMDDVVSNIEDDLEEIDGVLFGEGDWDDDDGEEWEDGEDEEDEPTTIRELNEGGFIEYECPHCRSKIYYDAKTFDLSQEHICPDCGKELFPEENEE